jgi:hypothetical protein
MDYRDAAHYRGVLTDVDSRRMVATFEDETGELHEVRLRFEVRYVRRARQARQPVD